MFRNSPRLLPFAAAVVLSGVVAAPAAALETVKVACTVTNASGTYDNYVNLPSGQSWSFSGEISCDTVRTVDLGSSVSKEHSNGTISAVGNGTTLQAWANQFQGGYLAGRDLSWYASVVGSAGVFSGIPGTSSTTLAGNRSLADGPMTITLAPTGLGNGGSAVPVKAAASFSSTFLIG